MTITAEQAAKLVERLQIPWPEDDSAAEVNLPVWVIYLCEEAAAALIASEAARKLAEERLAVAQVIARQGKDTIATVLLLEIAAALKDHERVVLTRDETSLGPRIMEFAAVLKEIDNG